MFKLTKLAEKHDSFIIHKSADAGVINFTSFYDSVEEAIEREAEELGIGKKEMAKLTKEYTAEELLEAAEEGYKWPMTLRLVEEIEAEEDVAEEAEHKESTMFTLTKFAKQFDEFIIHHTTESGDFNLTEDYESIEDAIKYEAQGAEFEEMAEVIKQYTQEEVIAAAESGYGWPVELGLVEELDPYSP